MSSGGRVFPSVTQGGLSRATSAVFDRLAARRAEGREERRLSVTEQSAAVNQFQALTAMIPVGTKLGELGDNVLDIFGRAFGLDPQEHLELDINPETLDTLMGSLGLDFIQDPEAVSSGIQNDAILRLFQLPRQSTIEAENAVNAAQTAAFGTIMKSEELMRRFTLDQLGDDPVTVTLPAFGDREAITREFTTPTAANIWASAMLARDQLGLELDLTDEEVVAGLVNEIQEGVQEAGFSILSSVIRERVLPIYNASLEEGGEGVDVINRFIDTPGRSQGEIEAIMLLVGSIGRGDNAFLAGLNPQVRNFILLGQAIRDIVGPEAALELLPDFTSIDERQFGRFRNPLFRRINFETVQRPVGRDLSLVPPDVLVLSIQDLLEEGILTREELVELTSEADVAAAELNISSGVSTPGAAPRAGPDLTRAERRIDRQGDLVASQRRQLANLEGRVLSDARGQRGRNLVNNRIDLLKEKIAVSETSLPFETEAGGAIPQGGIDPQNMPASVRSLAVQLNTLLRRQEQGGSGRQLGALQGEIRSLVLRIRTAMSRL